MTVKNLWAPSQARSRSHGIYQLHSLESGSTRRACPALARRARCPAMKPAAAIQLGVCAIAIGLGLSVSWLPAPLPSDAPVTPFSAERAWQHASAIARQPHPAASEENRRVRAYLCKSMTELGLAVRELPGKQEGTELGNLYAELPVTAGGQPAILLVSHYDSVSAGPGAADCASGVAALLENVRAVRASGSLRNGIAVLFTDGEENGLLGARAFTADQPELWRDVRVVLNLEARGNRGPVMMFETSPGARRLIARLSKSCLYPVACSFSREIYRRMPNDTEFLKAGRAGMNFAFVGGGLEYYHTAQDTPENLSRRTLQHYGS
ncbi:MAG: M20/M25/M40 family metallo-hydrolase [Pedosphaera sp.]|nr:M20/M25/M40 family metallo-hydrolase [Pedosphaera sp.]